MKNIVPALNKLQLALMDRSAPLSDIGIARKELFAAIREAIINAMIAADPSDKSLNKECSDMLAKFDRLNGD
jgi:hypothetical protein